MKDEATVKRKAEELAERQMHAIARAISDPRRFEIMQEIAGQKCSSCSHLRESQPITAATLSHHLKELEQAELITATKQGKFVNLSFRREVWDAYLARLGEI